MSFSESVKSGIELCVDLAKEGFGYTEFNDLMEIYEAQQDFEMCEAIRIFLSSHSRTRQAVNIRLINEFSSKKRSIKKTYE